MRYFSRSVKGTQTQTQRRPLWARTRNRLRPKRAKASHDYTQQRPGIRNRVLGSLGTCRGPPVTHETAGVGVFHVGDPVLLLPPNALAHWSRRTRCHLLSTRKTKYLVSCSIRKRRKKIGTGGGTRSRQVFVINQVAFAPKVFQ